jgi:hypothetical protein
LVDVPAIDDAVLAVRRVFGSPEGGYWMFDGLSLGNSAHRNIQK